MHYHDGVTGIKDFDVWFFYPFNQKHLPTRTTWTWDYQNQKFGRDPSSGSYKGRRVDVIVRSIKNHVLNDPEKTILNYLEFEKTISAGELAKKAVVLISPGQLQGKLVWYREKI